MSFDFTMHPLEPSLHALKFVRRPDLARGRRILAAYRQVPAGERHGLVERFEYASLRSMNVMACRYRKRLAPSCDALTQGQFQ